MTPWYLSQGSSVSSFPNTLPPPDNKTPPRICWDMSCLHFTWGDGKHNRCRSDQCQGCWRVSWGFSLLLWCLCDTGVLVLQSKQLRLLFCVTVGLLKHGCCQKGGDGCWHVCWHGCWHGLTQSVLLALVISPFFSPNPWRVGYNMHESSDRQ